MSAEAGLGGRAASRATILVFDSGLGGLTVLRAIRDRLPEACLLYALDDAAFPYGDWPRDALVERVLLVVGRVLDAYHVDVCVIACNTASTLVLPHLRARFQVPFVGTVPAIKPAAERSKSGLISVLATPGTVRRDYTNGLIRDFASHCRVTLVGSRRLAPLAEAELTGAPADLEAIRAEIAPAFVEHDGARTDTVVLACTHYPWLLDAMRTVAPWEVEWVDPAPAIARRVLQVLPRETVADAEECGMVLNTAPADTLPHIPPNLLSSLGLLQARTLNLPAERHD